MWKFLAYTFGILAAANVFLPVSHASGAELPPNVVVILTDDQGYNDLSCYGSPDIDTPELDRMGNEGVRFTDFYVAASICSASRAALLSGCYPSRVGAGGSYSASSDDGLAPEVVTIAEVARQAGYATAAIGKWHLGHKERYLPTRQGFDRYFGLPYSNDMTHDPEMPLADTVRWREGASKDTFRNGKPKRGWVPLMRDEAVIAYPADQSTLTRRYTEEALRFMDEYAAQPFFLYLAHTMPHTPLFVSEEFEGHNPERGLYGSVIEEVDWSVGQILDRARELAPERRTLVIFTSDNGPWLAQGKHGGSAAPLRDGKFTWFEGGMRVPCIAWAPGRVRAGITSNALAATIDILPTVAEFIGAELPEQLHLDGASLLPLLTGREETGPHDAIIYWRRAIGVGKWKLHTKIRIKDDSYPTPTAPALYDLQADIDETHDLSDVRPDVVSDLEKRLDTAISAMNEYP